MNRLVTLNVICCLAIAKPAAASTPLSVEAFALDSESAGDRVGPKPKLETDGQPDWSFTATLTGKVDALILTICPKGKHSVSQWDTLAAKQRAPKGFHWRDGGATWVLGVVDASDKLLNRADGSIARLTYETAKPVKLHAAQNGFLKSGVEVCLTALGPKKAQASARIEIP